MPEEQYEALDKLNRDLRAAARLIGRNEARYLVDIYYQIQDFRVSSGNRHRTSTEAGKPSKLLEWTFGNLNTLESNIKSALGAFAMSFRAGEWMQSICGIGPVISAGFLANLSTPIPETVGHWWRFAGLDPTREWLGKAKSEALVKEVLEDRVKPKGKVSMDDLGAIAGKAKWTLTELLGKIQRLGEREDREANTREDVIALLAKRPWAASVKQLCFHAGSCFIKVQGNAKDFYGALYTQRRAYEEAKNDRGDYRDQAEKGAKRVRKTTDAYKVYITGKLPDGHMLARSRRWVTKLFLSHVHEIFYQDFFGREPPKPFALSETLNQALGTDHRHYIAPPNLPVWRESTGKKLVEMGA